MTLYLFFESCVCFAELLSLLFLTSEIFNFTFLMRHLNRSRVFLPKKKRTSFFTELLCLSLFFFFFEFSAAVFSSFFFFFSIEAHLSTPMCLLTSRFVPIHYMCFVCLFFLSFCVIFIATRFRVFPVSFFVVVVVVVFTPYTCLSIQK